VLQQKAGIGGGGWVHPKGADSMTISEFCFKCLGWLWVGHCCPPPMHKWVEKTVLSPCTAPISSGEAFIPVWASGCQLSAVNIASSVMEQWHITHH